MNAHQGPSMACTGQTSNDRKAIRATAIGRTRIVFYLLRVSLDINTALAGLLLQMSKTPEQLFAQLDSLGIGHTTVKHPPLFTVEQSRALRGQIPGGHTKNLFLRDKKYEIYLVVALEDADIDLKSLHRRLGASGRFSFGSSDLLREVLGVEPGAITHFGAI